MHTNSNGEIKVSWTEELAAYYALQEKVAQLPAGERVAAALGLLDNLTSKQQSPEAAKMLLVTMPTLRNIKIFKP